MPDSKESFEDKVDCILTEWSRFKRDDFIPLRRDVRGLVSTFGRHEDHFRDWQGRVIAMEQRYDNLTPKIDAIHMALFDPMDGLVNLRKWLCRLSRWAAGIFVGTSAILAALASMAHDLHWWGL